MADNTSSSPKTGLLAALASLSRPQSHPGELEFDSGINTSAAWTVSLNNPEGNPRLSVTGGGNAGVPATVKEEEEEVGEPPESVDGDDSALAEEIRPARALYAFQGKAEFRELTRVEAGDDLEIVKEDVGEGWSLARLASSARDRDDDDDSGREMGLIPRSYYIVSPQPVLRIASAQFGAVHCGFLLFRWSRNPPSPFPPTKPPRSIYRLYHPSRRVSYAVDQTPRAADYGRMVPQLPAQPFGWQEPEQVLKLRDNWRGGVRSPRELIRYVGSPSSARTERLRGGREASQRLRASCGGREALCRGGSLLAREGTAVPRPRPLPEQADLHVVRGLHGVRRYLRLRGALPLQILVRCIRSWSGRRSR